MPAPFAGTPPSTDRTKPSAPGTPVVSNALTNQTATVTVSASTDNVAVAGYAAFLDGGADPWAGGGKSVTNTLNLTGVPAGAHSVVVRAFDAAGNVSDASTATQFVMPGPVNFPAFDKSTSTVGRKKLLVFGNSLALQSLTTLLNGTNSTTIAADARRGATVIPVASAAGITVGDKVAIQLYFGGVHYSTVTATDTVATPDTITIADKLPATVKLTPTSYVHWFTTDGVDDWVYQQPGPVYSACALLGMPVDVIHGYGYGGAYAQMMLTDLERVLRVTTPDFVVFSLFENDIGALGSGNAAAEIGRLTRLARAACELCIAAGAKPIFLSNYPATSVGTAQEAAVWDALKAVQIGIGEAYPQAVGIDASTPWLGTTTATTRPPLAGWTDGIHPVIQKQAVIGKLLKAAFENVIGTSSTFKSRSLQYVDMSGTGGNGTGAGFVAGGSVATGITLAAYTNIMTTASKTANDKQAITLTNAAATAYGTHYVSLTTATLPVSETALGGQWIKGAVRLKINQSVNINRAYLTLKFSPSNQQHLAMKVNGGATGGWLSDDNYFDGEEFVIETGSVRIPNDATGYTLELRIETNTEATVGAVIGDFEVSEFGIVPGYPSITDREF